MKVLMIVAATVGTLFLIACTAQPQPSAGETPIDLAEQLIGQIAQWMNDPDFELPDPSEKDEWMDLGRKIFYVPQEDASDTTIINAVMFLFQFVISHFNYPATATQIDILSITECNAKSYPVYFYFISDPPEFVLKTYMMNLYCEKEDGTKNSVVFPMITVFEQDQAYMFTLYIKETDSATELAAHPMAPL